MIIGKSRTNQPVSANDKEVYDNVVDIVNDGIINNDITGVDKEITSGDFECFTDSENNEMRIVCLAGIMPYFLILESTTTSNNAYVMVKQITAGEYKLGAEVNDEDSNLVCDGMELDSDDCINIIFEFNNDADTYAVVGAVWQRFDGAIPLN